MKYLVMDLDGNMWAKFNSLNKAIVEAVMIDGVWEYACEECENFPAVYDDICEECSDDHIYMRASEDMYEG